MLRFVWYSPSDVRRRRQPAVRPAEVLHRVYADHIWLSPYGYMRASAALSRLLWPVIVAVLSLRWTWRHGPGVRLRTGKTLLRQIGEQLDVARRSSMLPLRYYQNELFDDALRPRADEYILFHEFKTVHYGLIKMGLAPDRRELLKPKDAFADACRTHQVPTVPLYLLLEGGKAVAGTAVGQTLPPEDLFVKRRNGKGGRNVERWNYDAGEDRWTSSSGERRSAAELRDHLLARSRREATVVQPVLHLHPDIADLSPRAFPTIRTVSQIDEAGGVEITMAMARLPRDAAVLVDNVARGGFGAAVDLATGRLGPAADYRNAAIWHDRHPLTGGLIAGRMLPDWDEACRILLRAHRLLLPDRPCVSWDVGLTDKGPLLIEANMAGDLDFFQRAVRKPLGNERLGELFAYHVARAARGEAPLVATALSSHDAGGEEQLGPRRISGE